MIRLTRRTSLAAALAIGTTFVLPGFAAAAEITVFAAASLKNALDQIAADWQQETGNTVVISYEGSPKLAKQIEEGAPADLFISASKKWMDTLSDEKLIKDESRKDILGNTLILVAAGSDRSRARWRAPEWRSRRWAGRCSASRSRRSTRRSRSAG